MPEANKGIYFWQEFMQFDSTKMSYDVYEQFSL